MAHSQAALAESDNAHDVSKGAVNAAANADKRRHKRRELNVEVRFATPAQIEAKGQLHDISEGGLYMLSDMEVKVGDKIIAYPEGLGRLEGIVVRKDRAGFAIEFSITESQRTYLTKRIDCAQSGAPYLRLADRRKHGRMPINLDASARLPATGATFHCILMDISRSSAAVRSDHRPALGTEVKIGMLRGGVSRHTPDGFAITFSGAQGN